MKDSETYNIKKIPYLLEAHDDKRIDNYYWMRDDSRDDPEVIEYLENENKLACLLYTSPSPRDLSTSRMPSSA